MPIISNTKMADELGLTAGEVKVLAKKMPKTKIGLLKVSAENFMFDKDNFLEQLEKIQEKRVASFSKKSSAGLKAATKRWAEHNRLKAEAAEAEAKAKEAEEKKAAGRRGSNK